MPCGRIKAEDILVGRTAHHIIQTAAQGKELAAEGLLERIAHVDTINQRLAHGAELLLGRCVEIIAKLKHLAGAHHAADGNERMGIELIRQGCSQLMGNVIE